MMNFNIKNNKSSKLNFLLIIFGLIFITGCSDKKANESNNEIKSVEANAKGNTEDHHEEAAPTIATLNAVQIKAVGIRYGMVEQKQLTATIKANGNLSVPNSNKAVATSLFGGTIKSINVQIGSYVKRGQVIATILNPQFIQLQEEYLTIRSKITFAEQEEQRQKDLNSGNAGALKNLQSASTELHTLKTRSASLHQQILLMGINPNSINNNNLKSMLTITSPINGTVSNVFSKVGSYVDMTTPVAEIVDNGQLHLDLNVFEKDLPLLKVGQTIHFTLTNNPQTEYDAVVFSIGSAFENETKTIPVHCTVKSNKAGLIDGMNITGFVSINDVTGPAVPNEAIIEADGKTYIFIITDKKPEDHDEEEKEHAEKEDTTGNVNFEKIEVVKGVSNLGFTAVSFVQDIPKTARIVVKGAFFINARLTNTEGHAH